MKTVFRTPVTFSFEEPPSSGLIAAIRGVPETWTPGELHFQKDETVKDENPWFAGLYCEGRLIAFSSITAYYHLSCLRATRDLSSVWVGFDPVKLEDAHEFLVNGGEKPEWWSEGEVDE